MKRFLTILFFVLPVLLLTGCSDSADEKAIQANMQSMREAIQNHDKNAFMQHVAPRYHGQSHGNRASFERFVIQQLKANKKIYLYIADTSIEITGDIARVIFYTGTAGGPDQVPERGQLFKVQTNWKKFNGHWQLNNAKWRPALTLPSKK